jgi:syntaxin-binding protein 1
MVVLLLISDVAFDLSRYVPSLKNILQDLGDGILDIEKYPYIRDPLTLQSSMKANESNGQFSVPTTSLRTAKPSWHTKKAADSSSTDKEKTIAEDRKRNGRIIVFIIGGMTYSEMRSGYEIGNILRKDVYIGSTHIMTPASFVQNLKVLRNELKVESVMASRGSEEDLNVKASKGEAGKGWKSKLGWKAK